MYLNVLNQQSARERRLAFAKAVKIVDDHWERVGELAKLLRQYGRFDSWDWQRLRFKPRLLLNWRGFPPSVHFQASCRCHR